MTTTRTRTARRSATLIGIDPAQGDVCQDCDRDLTARLFRVRVTATGEVRHLGRKCAAYATGYPTTRLEHEARRLEMLRQRDRAWAAGTVAEMADHLRGIHIVNRDDTIEFAGRDGVVLVPVTEYAVTELARLQAALAAGARARPPGGGGAPPPPPPPPPRPAEELIRMAVLSRDEARKARASKHAERGERCPCGQDVHGNGRKTHQRVCEPYLRAHGYPLADGVVDGIRADLRDDGAVIDVPNGRGRRPVYASDLLLGIQRRIGAAVLTRRAAGNRRPLEHRELLDLLRPASDEALAELLAAHNGARR